MYFAYAFLSFVIGFVLIAMISFLYDWIVAIYNTNKKKKLEQIFPKDKVPELSIYQEPWSNLYIVIHKPSWFKDVQYLSLTVS